MKVMVSKTMTKFLKTNVKINCVETIQYREYTPKEYERYVNWDLLTNEIDFMADKHKFKVIQIIYTDDCYAMPKYLTTRKLINEFRNSDKTINGFINAIASAIEI